MIGTRVVLAELGVDQSVVERLVIDPQKEELLGLQVRLELESDELKRDGVGG
jgi:hypothetical protein